MYSSNWFIVNVALKDSNTFHETFSEGKTEKVSIILSGNSSFNLDISSDPIPDPVPPPRL